MPVYLTELVSGAFSTLGRWSTNLLPHLGHEFCGIVCRTWERKGKFDRFWDPQRSFHVCILIWFRVAAFKSLPCIYSLWIESKEWGLANNRGDQVFRYSLVVNRINVHVKIPLGIAALELQLGIASECIWGLIVQQHASTVVAMQTNFTSQNNRRGLS